MSSLNHPSILEFVGFSPISFNDLPYPTIITKFAPNGSLRDIIKLELAGLSPSEWDSTRKLINIYGIASGLSYLHSNHIIHRDIKPENILMDEYLFPKISDFGLSKITTSVSQSMNMQSLNGIKGTPIYMAPEVFRNEPYTSCVDVYSFSILTYEILTGITPFTNLTFHQLLLKIAIQDERPELTDDIPDAYKNLIEKCWASDPSQRPTFDQIVDDLKNNKDFITDTMNEEQFYDYVDYVDNYNTTFDMTHSTHFDDMIKKKKKKSTLKKVSINQKIIENDDENLSKEDQKIIEIFDDNEIRSFSLPEGELKKLDSSCQELIQKAESDSKSGFTVGVNFIEGKEKFPINIEYGEKYLQKASLNGCDEALFYYVQQLIDGTNIPRNLNKARQFFDMKKSKRDDPSVLLLNGKIFKLEKKILEAFQSFEKSAQKGNLEAMYEYGRMLIKGEGCTKNISNAMKNISISMKKGYIKSELYMFATQKFKQISYFKDLPNETQDLLITKFVETEFKNQRKKLNPKEKFKPITIENDEFLMLISNGSFDELGFENATQLYKNITIQLNYQSNNFKELYDRISSSITKMETILKNNFLNNITVFVIIPQTENEITDYLFKECKLISKVIIPSSVTKIGQSAFFYCESLAKITIPSSVNEIGESAFFGCSSLVAVDIPSSVTEISDSLFSDCTSLTHVNIPESVISIGSSSFSGCSSLIEIEIPSSVTQIGDFAFAKCKSLEKIVIHSALNEINSKVFRKCRSLKYFEIPPSVTLIDSSAFEKCTSLERIVIPDSVTQINESAFECCSSLNEVILPNSITEIDTSTFCSCSSLKEIEIPSSVISIGAKAFENCSSLSKISIPPTLKHIGDDAFTGCTSLTEIEIPSSVELYGVGLDNANVTQI